MDQRTAESTSIFSSDCPWDQMPDEKPKPYEAFLVYRDLGIERSVAGAYAEWRRKKALVGENAPVPSTWFTWEKQFCWRERADLWDAEQAAERDRIEANRASERTRRKQHELDELDALKLQQIRQLNQILDGDRLLGGERALVRERVQTRHGAVTRTVDFDGPRGLRVCGKQLPDLENRYFRGLTHPEPDIGAANASTSLRIREFCWKPDPEVERLFAEEHEELLGEAKLNRSGSGKGGANGVEPPSR